MNEEKEKEIIEKFTKNLNEKAKINEIPVIGREKEVKQLIYILSRMIKNNPLLIGHPGVGKTAIVEGLAQRIKRGQVPDYLKEKNIYQLDMISLMAGAKFQGELEERLKIIFKFMSKPENILFIDEIHLIVGAGRTQGSLDVSNLLKPLLSRGEIQCIGATTKEEYRRYLESDQALVRRFSNIIVPESTEEETLQILLGIRNYLEIYYELKIQDEALSAAVKLSQRYLTSTFLPDKAIDLLDETCGRIRSQMWYEPEIIEKNREKLNYLVIKQASLAEKNLTSESHSLGFEISEQKALLAELLEQDERENGIIQNLNHCKKEILELEKKAAYYQEDYIDFNILAKIKYYDLPELRKKVREIEKEALNNQLRKYFVDENDIAKTISDKYNLPIGKILSEEKQKLLFLPLILGDKIKGQNEALKKLTEAIFRARAGVQDPEKPLASFLFVGKTGVGKTEVALTIAEQLFDQRNNLVRFDMTEFSEAHSISKLIGSPPGYVGFEVRSRLEVIVEKKHSVVLFDEIEKSHPEVINLLLQILDNGFVTLSDGKEINFRNTIIIITTNLGSQLYSEFSDKEELKLELELELKKFFRPEFLNRLDEVIFFNSLDIKAAEEIIEKELLKFVERVKKEKSISLDYEQALVKKILNEAFSEEYGARNIKHYINREIGSLIARSFINGYLKVGLNYLINLDSETGEIKLERLSLLNNNKN